MLTRSYKGSTNSYKKLQEVYKGSTRPVTRTSMELQAIYKSAFRATRAYKTTNQPNLEEFDDILCGNAYLTAVDLGNIKNEDMVLMHSADGAQLYKNKISNFWIYIWVICDILPDNLDPFLFPGLHHLSAILTPHGTVAGSDFEDLPVNLLQPSQEEYNRNLRQLKMANNPMQYKELRLETGICKPTIFSGITQSFGSPKVFGIDIMHLPALNIPDLLIPLWCGTLKCPCEDKSTWDWAILKGSIWIDHGAAVANTQPYLPTLFRRTPRNHAKKISSGYKAIEYMNYIYALGPTLFYGILPLRYWQNFCRLVYGIRILCQWSITIAKVHAAHDMLITWEDEYEHIYYQRSES
ncbi:hypothetical protein OE88DRAFT_1715298 [Heliocybe sulcata]|uniref:Uncharacterized protein n=1 Tax=Heliocybe sulcata TaxID=5364 RepID=A0A5C3MLC1_9AGAM|nr:hypothetical protein OE88DRAFT_1715298 [Heliocybe sulcata]